MIAWNWLKEEYIQAKECNVPIGKVVSFKITGEYTEYACGHTRVHEHRAEEFDAFYTVFADGSIKEGCETMFIEPVWFKLNKNKVAEQDDISADDINKCRKDSAIRTFKKVRNDIKINRINCKCPGCKLAVNHENDIVTHGLNECSSTTFEGMLQRAKYVATETNSEICFAGDRLKEGMMSVMGISGTGNIVSYYPVDIGSGIAPNGRRMLNKYSPNEDSIFRLYDDAEKRNAIKRDEYWVNRFKPMYIWIKDYYYESLNNSQLEQLNQVTIELGINIKIITTRKSKNILKNLIKKFWKK